MAHNVFYVEHESGSGSYKYSDTTLTTNDGEKVTVQNLTSFRPQQITLIKLCENLEYLITKFKFTNLSITMPVPGVPGYFVYNNLEMKAAPAVNADFQSWEIKWNTEDGKAKKLMFKRRFIRKSSQATTALLQAEAAGHSLWGGNKRRKKTKRKKTKKQISR